VEGAIIESFVQDNDVCFSSSFQFYNFFALKKFFISLVHFS